MNRGPSMLEISERMLPDVSAEPTDLPLSFLEDITNNFSEENEIGRGGFGVVYKGCLPNGTVAVKRLSAHVDFNDKRFYEYIGSLMRVKHKNIVQFLGYCACTRKEYVCHNGHLSLPTVQEMLLCFEFLPGGSLTNYITDASCGLQWRTRYQIIKGICEGLHYLHQRNTLHLDLKPANILLDNDMAPKICDFSFPPNSSEAQQTKATHLGSIYLAPESYDREITSKVDIYALGVIIMELLTGQKGYSSVVDVLEGWRSRFGATWGDAPWEQIKTCSEICIRCMDSNPKRRPTMQFIIDVLGETEKMTQVTQRIFEMLNGTKRMDECIEANKSGLLVGQKMEPNILERIVDGSEEPGYIDLPLLQSITGNFSEKKRIGIGGCGEVYKGTLRNGVLVAVKRLFRSRTIEDKIFHREVQNLINVEHENIVRLLGYCSLTEEHMIRSGTRTFMVDIRERLLCFEHIRNGSLDSQLTDELRGLEWHTRFEIIMGICKGLLYLHKKKNITHMDLKPANILLDDHMIPKIIDFGLSRLEDNSQTATASRLVSLGYCAPEYLIEGKSSSVSDIYSLGVIIIELVTGCRKKADIAEVLRRWRHRWNRSSKHPPLGYQQVTKCLELVQSCTQHDPNFRPDIQDIIDKLNEIDCNADQFQCLEDMLGIEPMEIQFPFGLDQQVSRIIELINDTDDYFGFITKTSLRRLRAEPEKGIVPPRSKCSVTITMMHAPVMALPYNHYGDEKVTVRSTRADGGLADVDITEGMFTDKEGKVVDEVNVMVVLGKPPLAEES